jgi:hypoxanthine phosphoribosyltransferase
MSDLVRAMTPPPPGLQLEFVRASSYGSGTVSSGKVTLDAAVSGVVDVKGRHVLLVNGWWCWLWLWLLVMRCFDGSPAC